ncbi:LPS export ABC transporter periplasmic protein LptC [Selenomonas sp.]|uniref:LPS export ABC transporter periplasmic protein LptC n=1 Tax=Selenomonas sp. TaxID=2053611 RepID=UPI0025FA775E|nr:LPS export ABC transporter periplasmic protein LptC [Selenomonas sp.]MCI6283993.1 LPS export ABC transporter periplasmic protein LptC [Selenomonas sp.]
MSNKQKVFIGLAVLLFACVIIWAVRTEPQAPEKQPLETESKTMTYDGNTIKEEKNGKVIWELTSEAMTMDADTKDVDMENLTGKFYGEGESRTVTLTAKHGHYDAKTKDVTVTEEIDVKTSDGAALTCDKLIWSEKDAKLTADGNAYIKHEDMEARADKIESTNLFHHFKAIGHAHIVKGAK